MVSVQEVCMEKQFHFKLWASYYIFFLDFIFISQPMCE